MSEPRKHHYLPVCYLKGFTRDNSPKGCLHCFDLQLDKWFALTPRTAAYERDLYKMDVPEDEDAFFVERIFSETVEGRFPGVLERIISNQKLPQSNPDFNDLANFIALQAARVPATLERIERFSTGSMLAWAKRLSRDPDEFKRLKNKAMDDGQPLDVSEQNLRDLIDSVEAGRFQITLNATHRQLFMLRGMDVMLKWIARQPWRLLISNDDAPDLICSDRPVIWTFPQLLHPGMADDKMFSTAHLTFPLTHRMHISIDGKFDTEGTRPCPSTTVAAVNHRIALHASRFVYSPNEIFAYRANNKKLLDSRNLAPLLEYRKRRGGS